MSRLMTQSCQIVALPYTGQTEETVVAAALGCSHPFPANRHNWTEATDFEGLEIFTAHIEDVEKGQVLTVNGRTFTIEQVRDYQSRYGTLNYLHLLLRQRN